MMESEGWFATADELISCLKDGSWSSLSSPSNQNEEKYEDLAATCKAKNHMPQV